MYAEQLTSLYLNKSKLHIYDAMGNKLKYEAEVEDFCKITSGEGLPIKFPFTPDFSLVGNLVMTNQNNPSFYINSLGKDTLYITGVNPETKLSPYRIPGNSFSSYWEQPKMGYLFQVVNNNILNMQHENSRRIYRKVQA